MPRVVIDPGVIVSGLLSPDGPPGQILAAVKVGDVEMILSEHLLDELGDVLGRPKFRGLIAPEEAVALDDELRRVADVALDPANPEPVTRDADDDYLVALAKAEGADAIITGDADLQVLRIHPPVLSPRAFLDRLRQDESG